MELENKIPCKQSNRLLNVEQVDSMSMSFPGAADNPTMKVHVRKSIFDIVDPLTALEFIIKHGLSRGSLAG